MAEDVEIIVEGDTCDSNDDRIMAAISPTVQVSMATDEQSGNGISSTESADCIIDVVSTESQPPDLVSSISDSLPIPSRDGDANIVNSSDNKNTTAQIDHNDSATRSVSCNGHGPNSDDIGVKNHVLPSSSQEDRPESNGYCEIVVDDNSANEASPKYRSKTKVTSTTTSNAKVPNTLTLSTESCLLMSQASSTLSRSTTPSPSVHSATPSTPGTPRQRSGSLSGPSPRPSTRNTPSGERQRSGSVGEIDKREKSNIVKSEVKQGVRVLDHLDILQLPRPRNPGGVLPQNGHHDIDSNSSGAVNLVINNRQAVKRKNEDSLSNSFSSPFTNFLISSSASSTSSSNKTNNTNNSSQVSTTNTSYLISNIIKTTPNKLRSSINLPVSLSGVFDTPVSSVRRWSTSINEGIERPQPSSVVDSEGVAKKIARLDSQGILTPTSVNSLWTGSLSSHPETQQFRNLRPVLNRTPPERPKPPRRDLTSPLPDIMPGDRIISPSPTLRSSPASSSQTSLRNSEGVLSSRVYSPSQDHESGTPTSRSYKCRVCHTIFSSPIMYAQHMNRHGNSVKLMKCPLCDYITCEKASFRRHRRLHSKSSPGGNVLRCGKCSFSTLLPRKLKDHYQMAHHIAIEGPMTEYNDSRMYRYGSDSRNGSDTHGLGLFSSSYIDNPSLNQSDENTDRLSYTFPSSSRHLNYSMDHYGVPYIRPRHDNTLTNNYIRSMVNSDNRQQPSSTITSSSYFLPSSCGAHHLPNMDMYSNHDTCRSSNCNHNHLGVKIKVEPDLDAGSDVSSTATPDHIPHVQSDTQGQGHEDALSHVDSSTTLLRPGNVIRHRSLDSVTNNLHNHVTAVSQDILSGVMSTARSRTLSTMDTEGQLRHDYDLDNGREVNVETSRNLPSCTVVKSDTISRGVQCSMAVIKSETGQGGIFPNANHQGWNPVPGIDRGVQCNLYTTQNTRSQSNLHRLPSDRTISYGESDISEPPGSVSWESRCEHCGIVFDDEVIYSIHIGCHSHTDPFVCNVCGKQCGNKYGFYSHIMRGHHF